MGAPGPVAPPPWLIVGSDLVARALSHEVPDVALQVVAPGSLADQLPRAHARMVVVVHPSAYADDVDAAAAERRRPRSGLRAVLLTDADNVGGRIDALEAGFDDAFSVAVDPRELAHRLRRLDRVPRGSAALRNGTMRGPIPIALGVELDLTAYELRRSGVPQRLRPKELQLLALLATHPRRAFSRRELIDRIWGPAFAGDPRTIDVHLRWLRSKVEADPEHPSHLVTVRGRGYRFDPPATLTNR